MRIFLFIIILPFVFILIQDIYEIISGIITQDHEKFKETTVYQIYDQWLKK